MQNHLIVAIHNSEIFRKELNRYLSDTFTIIEKNKTQYILPAIRINQVECVVVFIEQEIHRDTHFEQFRKGFSTIPCIAVINLPNMELARYCGSIGIECVLPYEKINHIHHEITRVCAEKNSRIALTELSINKEDPTITATIREALVILERDYVKILNINEIAELIEISESTLSRKFTQIGLPGPKKILMSLKIKHAIKLMHNKKLNIHEISALSGFTDEKRMAESFRRNFGIPPGEYRNKYLNWEHF